MNQVSNPKLDGAVLLYNGRTLEIRVYVNTDEPMDVVVDRIKAVAAGPKKVMTTMLGTELKPELSTKFWETIWEAASKSVAEPKAKHHWPVKGEGW